ncbi:Ion channel, partial [Trichostrongylus colubriformis]
MILVDKLRIQLAEVSTVAVHIALILGVAAYTIFGALVIRFLEAPEEPKILSKNDEIPRTFTRVYLGSEVSAMDPKVYQCLKKAVERVMASTDCDEYQIENMSIDVIDECYENAELSSMGSNPALLDEPVKKGKMVSKQPSVEEEIAKEIDKWSFGNALIFTFSVITTIGYGHIAPETFYGRLFCIFFGLVGVPFTLLTVADLGMFLSLVMRKAVGKMFSLFDRCRWKQSKPLQTSLPNDDVLATARDLKNSEDDADEEPSEESSP